MSVLDWTYEVPAGGADAAGLEEYLVYRADGADAGKVVALLRHADDLWLAVDRGTPPVTHDRRAVHLRDVASIDHDSLAIRLRAGVDVERAPRLAGDRAVEQGPADAVRVATLPRELAPGPVEAGRVAGPRDSVWAVLALVSAGALTFATFVVVMLIGQRNAPHWRLGLIAIPAALAVVMVVASITAWVHPYESRKPRT